jgi:hypothetical protein
MPAREAVPAAAADRATRVGPTSKTIVSARPAAVCLVVAVAIGRRRRMRRLACFA